MITASYRFYSELNEFLPAVLRQRRFNLLQCQGSTVMEMIELLNIPCTAVELILVNGEPMDFSCIAQADDRISVYPLFRTIDISTMHRIKPV
jgi:hypothetical protein